MKKKVILLEIEKQNAENLNENKANCQNTEVRDLKTQLANH